MRGDSLRDLYAKVLALCGLGLLACAGALVDYWPVQEDLPRVASAGIGPARAVPLTTPAVTRIVVSAPARAVVRAEAAPQPAPAPEVAVPLPHALPAATLAVDLSMGVPAELTAPPPRLDVKPEPAVLPPAPAVEVPLSDRPAIVGLLPAPGPAPSTNHHADGGDGLITGALKKTGAVAGASIAKTGDAIVKTGVVAGTSIMDVFRGLAGAVKKVTPFVP